MKKYTLGADVGGTKIQVGLVTPKNRLVKNEQFLIDQSNGRAAQQSILAAISAIYSKEVRAIGVGITGHVNSSTGVAAGSVNLPKSWNNVPLKSIILKKFRVPTMIDNDANCIALAEASVGKGKKYNAVMSITIGTGIGMGLVINKQLFRGGQDATELGHTIINKKYSFENLVSGPSLVKNFRKKTGLTKTSYEIVAAANKGNRTARALIREMSQWLAIGLNNAMLSYSPEIIVLGGGLACVPSLIRPAIKEVKKMLCYRHLRKTLIVTSSLGYNAGVIGSALLTKNQ